MLPVARLTDIGVGICCCHCPICCIGMTGIVITCSPDTFTNNLGHARITDMVLGFCGHIGTLITGCSTVLTNNLPTSRIGDTFVGCFTGTIVTGSNNTYVC